MSKIKDLIVTIHKCNYTSEKCYASKNCKRKARYMVYGDDGQPSLSRLVATTCRTHLHKAVDKAIKENIKTTKMINKIKAKKDAGIPVNYQDYKQ